MKALFRLTLLLLSLTSSQAWAHKYSMSLGTLEYRGEKGSWDFVLQLFNHDLDPVLNRYCKPQSCDKESFLKKHVLENLDFRHGNTRVKPEWVGIEWGVHHTHVYIQYLSKDPSPPTLVNKIMKQYYPLQQNRIQIRNAVSH